MSTMALYEVWANEDLSEVSMFPSEHPEEDKAYLTQDVEGNKMKKVKDFEAGTWEEALAIQYDWLENNDPLPWRNKEDASVSEADE